MGELLATIPKEQVGRPSKIIDTAVENLPTKLETIEALGFDQKQAERFQTMAAKYFSYPMFQTIDFYIYCFRGKSRNY